MRKLIVLALTALLLVAASLAVLAEMPSAGEKSGKGQEMAATSEQVKAVKNLALAQQLAIYGQRNGSPAALAVAAEIALDNPYRNSDVEKVEEPISDDAVEEQPKTTPAIPVLEPAKLLQEARAMAGDDEAALPIIGKLQERLKEKSRGRQGGALLRYDRVNVGMTNVYKMTFKRGSVAAVEVKGDGDTDLDLYIYDSFGNLVIADRRAGDYCGVWWTPLFTHTYTVKVVNLGIVYNNYLIATN